MFIRIRQCTNQFPQSGKQNGFRHQQQRFWRPNQPRNVAYTYEKPYFWKRYISPYNPKLQRQNTYPSRPQHYNNSWQNFCSNKYQRPNFRQLTCDNSATFSSRQSCLPTNGNWDGQTKNIFKIIFMEIPTTGVLLSNKLILTMHQDVEW